ncbi:hypothetical protein MT349_13795 [Rathayibacter caricis]|uniref:hypothetical protein n=1 Tax=Rathayibacter caricis TaxID=110936 RepID=UPI001FB4CE5B|nr:hypothetical protein [Rathayibacter caricis]MCJ1696852.1 hypothetical protein [Rathayibacter caricis]
MVDDGNRGRGDHSEGEDRPKEPERQVGGSEWLLQQLSGGRLKSIFDAPRATPTGSEWKPVDPQSAPAAPAAPSESEEAESAPEESSDASEQTDGAPDESALEEAAPEAAAPERPSQAAGRDEPQATTVHVPPLVAAEASAPPEPTLVLEPTPPLQTSGAAEEREEASRPNREPDSADEPDANRPPAPAPEPERPADPEAEAVVDRGPAPEPEQTAPPVRPQPRFDAARRDPAESASTPRSAPPVAGPPALSTPPVARDAQQPEEPRDDRPAGATAPSQRDTAPNGTVYQWPDPRGGWDAPPVWEDVVTPPADADDDDAGDEELWRGTAFAWNLEPTDSGDPADPSGSRDAASAEGADAPFSTTPATAHANAAGEKTPRSRPAREKAPREKTPRAARQKTPRADAPAPSGPTTAGIATEPPSIAPLSPPSPGRTAGRRRLLIALIAVGVVVILAVLAAIGYAVASANRPEAAVPVATQAPSEEASATPEPTAVLPTVGPLPAGTYAWSALLGGECLQPFDSVWAEEFTVVDCAAPHAGQLVAAEPLTETVFPGSDALALSVASLCQAAGVVDVAAAETYGDVQVSASFPVTQEQWDAGERRSFCFVDRAGGGELVGSLAGTPAG